MPTNRFKSVEELIDNNSDLPLNIKRQLKENIQKLSSQQMNIMVTGATGCGKSSTINALFETEKAVVGVSPNPETMDIKRYDLDNLVIWDTPGLGDGKEADERHTRNIINKLHEKDARGNLLIDLVLVILDGSSRDLGTSYDLINSVIIPNLGEKKEGRILVAVNQCDMAMKGRYWNAEMHVPEQPLIDFLEEKVKSVRNRILLSTGVDVDPMYYSAGFKEVGMPQEPSYNINKLLYYIISKAPEEKRFIVYRPVNQETLRTDSQLEREPDYRKETQRKVEKSAWNSVMSGAAGGAAIGASFGGPIGGIIGGVVGGAAGYVSSKCYITTATCEAFGKPDDCYELTMFRSFRDNWLTKQPDGKDLIEKYYATAPSLVDMIDKCPERSNIYTMLRNKYLSPCLRFIETKQYQACKDKYIAMVNYLYEMQEKLSL